MDIPLVLKTNAYMKKWLKLKFIGEIETVSYNGLWVVRTELKPKIGENVYNQKKQKIGKIINIIGPVDHPYILVRPFGDRTKKQLQIIGEKMYILLEAKGKNKKLMR